jgi:diacylglycerol kinase (ATP)
MKPDDQPGPVEAAPLTLLIANSTAGGRRARKIADKVARALAERGIRAGLVFTQGPGDAGRIASAALDEGCRAIVACGGDGTVHEVVGAMANSPATLGIVPCGRGNDLARALGIPTDLDGIVSTLVEGTPRRIDLGKIGDRYFSTVASMGFDSEAAELVYRGRVPFSGSAAYLCAALRTLVTFRSPTAVLSGDFGTFEGKILLAATGNTTTYGGGTKITPRAECDDGLLDVCMIRAVPRRTFLRFFPRIFAGTHESLPFIETRRTRRLRIETSSPIWVYADGEPVCRTPAEIEIAEQALGVVSPGRPGDGGPR